MDKKTYGITFNGHHSSEFGLEVLDGKEITMPAKIKSLVSIPWSNNEYDFTEVVGLQSYTDRSFTIPFNIINRNEWTKENMYIKWTAVMNWLMETTKKTPLYDDTMKQYYYMAEVRQAPDFDELRFRGILTVEFTCYPFRIAVQPEGDPMFDDIIWELDYFQNVSYKVLRTTFKPLNIGQQATVGAWATHYDSGNPVKKFILGETYTITDKKERGTTQAGSEWSYYLSGVNEWIIEQDIIQAQNGVTEVVIKNNGGNAVSPIIRITNPVSIVRGNEVFNIFENVTKSQYFKLKKGDNYLTITGINTQIEFEFYKELI